MPLMLAAHGRTRGMQVLTTAPFPTGMLAAHGRTRKLGYALYAGASSTSKREACVHAGRLAVGGADGGEQRG